jgi:hypothetical protein
VLALAHWVQAATATCHIDRLAFFPDDHRAVALPAPLHVPPSPLTVRQQYLNALILSPSASNPPLQVPLMDEEVHGCEEVVHIGFCSLHKHALGGRAKHNVRALPQPELLDAG